MKHQTEFDEIGYWSEIKLEILKEYASAYSKILAAQKNPALEHVYIDAFAGAGMHLPWVPNSRTDLLLEGRGRTGCTIIRTSSTSLIPSPFLP